MKQQSSLFIIAVIAIVAIFAFTIIGQQRRAQMSDAPAISGQVYRQPQSAPMPQMMPMQTEQSAPMQAMMQEPQMQAMMQEHSVDSVGCSQGAKNIKCAPSMDASCRCMPDGTPACTCK